MAMQDKLPEALDALNQVRRRAGFTKDLTAATQTEFMKLLRHERKIELAFESIVFGIFAVGVGIYCTERYKYAWSEAD